MSAEIINLSEALIRERRSRRRSWPPPRAHLIEIIGGEFAASAEHIRPIREAILFAMSCNDFAAAKSIVEELIELPCADDDSRFCRDSLAVGFGATLQIHFCATGHATEYFEDIADRLFPMPAAIPF